MELTLDQALQQAVAAHREGKLQDAEHLYRAILRSQPNHSDANHNLGVLALAMGKPLEALPLFELALNANPAIDQFWLSYIDALINIKRCGEAKQVMCDAEQSGVPAEKLGGLKQRLEGRQSDDTNQTATSQMRSETENAEVVLTPSKEQLSRLRKTYEAGKFSEAEEVAGLLTEMFPQHPFGWKVLGAVFNQTGRFNEALMPMQKSVELSPQDAEAHNNLGITLQELGRLDEVEAAHRQAIALKPDYAEAHFNLGITLQELGRLDEAEVSYQQAITLKPEYAEAHNNLGNTLQELGRLDEAEASLGEAITLRPDSAEAHNNLGNTLKELGRLDVAEASYRQAIYFKPDYADAHCNLGVTLQDLGRSDEAKASYRQAIALKPDYAEAHHNLATARKFSLRDEQFFQMKALYDDEAISEVQRCHICFALAKASDDIGELINAFEFYAEGNALRKKQLHYHKEQDKKLFEKLKAYYPHIAANELGAEIASPEHIPIFIVGMPRSGTTLVEQIISSHLLVTGAGELRFVSQFGRSLAVGQTPVHREILRAFREQYLKTLQARSRGNTIVTDKMPQNFRFLGLIAAALPEAKIIHVKRDPAAVCWSNYTQYFAKNTLSYCYSLEDILHYQGLHENLMKFWRHALPGRVYDLDYECLTEDQESESRKLIEHLELNWDDRCLSPQDNQRWISTASNMQARKKVYQGSSSRWRRYLPYLDGVLDHVSTRGK